MNLKLTFINLLLCLFFFTENSRAQTFISGAVSGTWTKDGNPYLFIDNVSVNSGSILNIEPGVQIFIGKEISMNVYGVINAIGTKVDPIIFSSTSDTVYWNRINLGVSGSVFKYCNFSGCNKGIAYIISSYGSSDYYVDILNCEFTNCKEDAIYLNSYGDCYWNGPYGSPNRGNPNICPTIASCIFKKVNVGIHLITNGKSTYYGNGYGKITGTIKNCLFDNISSHVLTSEKGLSDYSRIDFFNNVISNSYQGITAVDPFDFYIINNIFSNCSIGIKRSGINSSEVLNNCFYENDSLNFIGYPVSYGDINWTNNNGVPCDISYNIYMDPIFEDTISYRLLKTSPCIDAGYNDYVNYDNDLYNNARIWDGNNDGNAIVDIGVYEYGAPRKTSNVKIEICQGENYNGHIETGVYYDTLISNTGFDSIVHVDLTVNPTSTTDLVESICEGESIQIGDQIFTETGEYTVTLENQFGCDSIVNLKLSIHSLPEVNLLNDTTITEDQDIYLDAGGGFSEYLWSNGNNDQTIIISGLKEGTYEFSVIVTNENECSNSDTIIITVIGPNAITNLFENRNFLIYPNPTNDIVYIEADGDIDSELTISILDDTGKLLITKKLINILSNQKYKIDISTLKSGIYLLKLNNTESIRIYKVIKD